MTMRKFSLLLFALTALSELVSAQSNGICYLDGITYTTLAQAIACAGATGTIEVTPSARTLLVPSSAVIPAGVALRVDQGAILSIANAVTLTVDGPLQAPAGPIFAYTGTASVVLGDLAAEHVIPNWFPGSDMGAQLMNAAAALPTNGGVLYPAPGSYRIATPVDFTSSTKAVTVWCEKGVQGSTSGTTPRGATEFIYSGAGVFFTFNAETHSGMYGCTLVGPDGITGTTAIGAWVGGGANNGIFDNFSHNDISGFGNGGLVFGDTVYIAVFQENVIHDNGPNGSKNIVVPPGALNFGENITFIGGTLTNRTAPFSTTCVNIQKSTDMHFFGVSFDHCGLTANGLNVDIYLTDDHVENTGGTTSLPFFQFGPNCSYCYLDWRGGFIREDTPSTRLDFFEDDSTVSNVNNQISITSGIMVPSENTPQLVLVNHPCCDQVSVGPIQNGQGGYTFTSMVGGTPIASIAISTLNGIEIYKANGIAGRTGASELGVDPTTQRWVMNNGNSGTEFIPGAFHQLITPFAPTIAANGCGGAGASVATNNGPASFSISVGTTPATACTFTLPITAVAGWNCTASDLTTSSTNVFLQKQTATTTTTATITNFNDVAAASNFGAGDILAVSCFAR
jgi:hypothetical protein